MKIIDYQTFIIGNPWKNWLFIKLYTDEGVTGLGEATGGLSTRPHQADIDELARFFLDEDPRHPQRIWSKMYKGRFLRSSRGMNGVELACWDIVGKTLGVPIWQLLGGKCRDHLRVYANGWYKGPRDPQFFADSAAEMVNQGYTALKFDPFGSALGRMDRESERRAINIVGAVRDAVGPNVDILIEGHDRFTSAYAIHIGRQLTQFDPMLFETPVDSMDVAATLEVAKAIDISVAVGERYDRITTFIDLLAPRVIDIIQPEVIHLGLTNIKKVCGIAEAAGALVASHQAQSPLCTAINAHLHASIPNFLIHENFDDSLEPWIWDIFTGVPRVEKGYLSVPDSPGWGVELVESEAAKYPYSPHKFLQLFEEGWETRQSA
jgi:galactonate dehydratase